MKASAKDQKVGHTNWLQSLSEARNTCRKALAQASVDVSDPTRALWPAVRRQRMTREHQTVAQCHAAVIDYWEHIEPFSARVAGHWSEDVVEPHEFPDGDTLAVSLHNLHEWADRRYEEQSFERDELTGTRKVDEYHRVHLPTSYSRAVFEHLNKCLEGLKLAADPPRPDRNLKDPSEAW